MKCKAVIREIEEMEAGAGLSAETNAHLLTCASCRAFAQERAALRLLVGSLDKVYAPADFDWRLKARLAEARGERAGSRRFLTAFAPGTQAVTIAACVALMLVTVVVYRQTRPLSSKQQPPAPAAGGVVEERSGPENENKGAPVNPHESATARASDGRQPVASNDPASARGIKGIRSKANRAEGSRETAPPRERIYSTDLASRGAEELRTEKQGSASAGAAPVIPVRLPSAASAQLKVEDGQGTKRTLSPVNFGGQDLIESPYKARLVPASEKGVW